MDFAKNIYGEKIRVNFIQRIRNEKKFANISEIKEKIKQDIETGQEILAGYDA